jgi:hypothetical protein
MDQAREARERLRQQRVHRRRLLLDALAKAEVYRARALARGSMGIVARHEAAILRLEQSLAVLVATLAAEEVAEDQP